VGSFDDAAHFQASDAAGVLGGLALGVVEVGGDRDHRLGDGLAQVVLGGPLQLLQDLGADLGRAPLLPLDLDHRVAVVALDDLVGHTLLLAGGLLVLAPHEALDGVDRVLRVVIAWRRATWPTRISPSLLKPTTDGVIRLPSSFLDHLGVAALHDGPTELVVPRSIPMIFFAISPCLPEFFCPGKSPSNASLGAALQRPGLGSAAMRRYSKYP